jgi:predicted transcriptional regulator
MTRNVRTINRSASISEALNEMMKYGVIALIIYRHEKTTNTV